MCCTRDQLIAHTYITHDHNGGLFYVTGRRPNSATGAMQIVLTDESQPTTGHRYVDKVGRLGRSDILKLDETVLPLDTVLKEYTVVVPESSEVEAGQRQAVAAS